MAACEAELSVRPGLPGHLLVVAVLAGEPVGVAEISVDGRSAELEKLFVDPAYLRRGIGRVLLDWACRQAAKAGATSLMIDSDPGAADFYRANGAVTIGTAPSASIPGRSLPRMRMAVDGT